MTEWRLIEGKGNGNYEISNFGEIRNKKTGRILKNYLNSQGYWRIDLSYEKNLLVHILLANAFIENIENKPFVDHINRIRSDNSLENLRWVTHQENICNRKAHGKSKYRGVTFDKSKNKFRTRIMINRKEIQIGYFKEEKEAALAFNKYIINNNLTTFYNLNEVDY